MHSDPIGTTRFDPSDPTAAIPAAGLVEACAFAAIVWSGAPLLLLLVVHGAVIAGLWAWIKRQRRTGADTSILMIQSIFVAGAGPIGALFGLILGRVSKPTPSDATRLSEWHDRISMSVERDEIVQLSDNVSIGRSLDLGAASPAPFTDVLTSSTVDQQQAVLGLIARRFHPDYLPALQLALRSPTPLIRVQAAAVAARIRSQLGDIIQRLETVASDPASTPSASTGAARQLALCANSGLLDDKTVTEIHAALAARNRDRSARLSGQLSAAATTPLNRATLRRLIDDDGLRRSIERQLLDAAKFADLRALRKSLAFATRGRLRYRRMPQSLASILARARNGSTSAHQGRRA